MVEHNFNNRSKNSLTSIGDGMNCTFEHVNIMVRRSRQSGVARATCPD